MCCSGLAKITEKKLDTKGTTKAAILKSDPKRPDLIVTTVFYTKPVYYLIMSSEDLKFVVCDKDVYNFDTGAKEIYYNFYECAISTTTINKWGTWTYLMN